MTNPSSPNWKDFKNTGNRADVLRYLLADGWEVKKQTFYNHCKTGKLTKNRSGVFTRQGVKKYASTWLIRTDTGETVSASEEALAVVKTRAEIKRINTAQKRDQFKLETDQKKYVLRSDMEAELVARAIVLDNGFVHLIQSATPDIVALVKGDQKLVSDLVTFLMEKKDELLNQYANTKTFKVILEGDRR